jgi:polyhydroxyalkanoate synthase
MTAQPKQARTTTGADVPDSKDPIERTVDNVNGQNIMGDFRPSDLLDTAGALAGWALTHPVGLAKASLGFWGELGKIAAGQSRHSVDPGDRRFSDPAWKENSIYSGLLQGYLALRHSMAKYATDSNLDERAHFLLDQVGDALAPSNFLLANPAALRRLKETRGLSLARGTENLAVTPGSVVLRTEMFELIQYAPQTEQVHQRPVLVVPSIVNKYYVFDLAPKRSILEYYVQKGMTVFVMVWRNPQPRHDRWGMSDYQDAVDAAVDATRAISKSEDVNIWAVCGAGPVVVSLAGYYAAKGTRKINSLLLVVSPLDMKAMAEAPSLGAFVDDPEAPTPSVVKKALHLVVRHAARQRIDLELLGQQLSDGRNAVGLRRAVLE